MKPILILLCLIIAFSSCKKKDNTIAACPYNSIGEARYVLTPDSVKVDSTIYITLVWENSVPCQISQGFQDSISGNYRSIYLKTLVDDCNCNNIDFGTTYRTYTFSVNSPGIQIIKTQKNTNVFQTDTVVVY